ncbi:MAG TPA: glycosyltransferase [Lysobacter sp.]|jgi:glycosyltransferase involved in cell wall biosynthesis|nr:glycosyltransferase [Lysobacter sp.]
MRTLHLIASLGPGGAERQLSLVAPALARGGVDVHVAYCSGGPNLARLEDSGVHLHALPSAGNHDPALAWKVFRLVRRLRPDVVQTWLLQMDILGGAAALFNRLPLIVSERCSATAYPPGWKTHLRLLVGRRATCIVANSQGGIDYWRPHLSADRLHLVRNCVSPAEHPEGEPVEALAPSLAGHPVVLFAGRYTYQKNISGLVDALILVARQHPDAAIRMFGEGPERESAERQVTAAGLARRIVVAGYSSQLATWMAHATVCVSVSRFEGHPNVVIEAAAAGCPLVLSDIPAHRELFDERSAALVPIDSPPRIAEAVLETLHDPARARERATRARVIAAEWDLATAATTYGSIYERAAATAR